MTGSDKAEFGPESEKPVPVTFLLLTYNQERFIGDAIAGALAQDYDPMDIIVSDDCSSDRTWEIINRKLADVKTRHAVKVRREPKSRGTLAHLLNAAKCASGELVVLAAGDDISCPDRVRKLADAWRRTGAAAYCSRYDTIDANGDYLQRNIAGIAGAQVRRWTEIPDGVSLIKGTTSAYDRGFLESIPVPRRRVLQEDVAASLWLLIQRKACVRVEDVLVAYRRHDEAVSSKASSARLSGIVRGLAREGAKLQQYLDLYDYLLEQQVGQLTDPATRARISKRIEASRHACAVMLRCVHSHAWQRFGLLFKTDDRTARRFISRRLFGLRFLALQKYLWRKVKFGPGRIRITH